MLPISEFKQSYFELKQSDIPTLSSFYNRNFLLLSEFFSQKFPETSTIMSKLDPIGMYDFCKESCYTVYDENMQVFKKGEECLAYYFIIYGDINLYEEEFVIPESGGGSNTLLKTLSAGSLYGHKIKKNFNYYAVSRSITHAVKISKEAFDMIIEQTNQRKNKNKMMYLKKYFPKFRMYSDDILDSLKGYFIRERYEKNYKILVDGEFDEFCYLIINGEVGLTKLVKKIKNVKEKIEQNEHLSKAKYIVLENLKKGEIFGMYSALKHMKNNYSAIVLSESAEVYKISKTYCLSYFGGGSGVIPMALKGIDSIQQFSIQLKLEYLTGSNLSESDLYLLNYNFEGKDELRAPGKYFIDESAIENDIKDAWKSVEDLESKLSQFKTNLLKGNMDRSKPIDVFGKMKENQDASEMKDFKKVMGDATNRVVGRKLNQAGNSKLKDSLNAICGIKGNTNNDENQAKLDNIATKKEGRSKNKLTNFDIEPIKPVEKEMMVPNQEVTVTTSTSTLKQTEEEKMPQESKPQVKSKKPGFSLKNLI